MENIYSWSKKAKCRNEGVLQENLTKKYCTDCPVKGPCNIYAIVHNELGIWGGTSEKDRELVSPVVVEAMKNQFEREGLLENRLVDPLGFQGHLGALQLVHTYPNAQTDLCQDSTLFRSA